MPQSTEITWVAEVGRRKLSQRGSGAAGFPPLHGLWRGCTPLLLPGVNGVFCVYFFFSFAEADPRWELRLRCGGKYSIILLIISACVLLPMPLKPHHASFGCLLVLVFLG